MRRGRPLAAIRKDDQLLIRTTSEVADQVRAIAFMKGESLHDWLVRVSAPEIQSAALEVFDVHMESAEVTP